MAVQPNRQDPYPSRFGPVAQRLPRQEPVVYGAGAVPDSFPGRESIARYERQGFLVLEGLFSRQELAVLQSERDRLRASAGDIDPDWVIGEPESPQSVRSIFMIHRLSPLFRRLARDARLVRAAERILGEPVYIHQSRVNYKPGFCGKEFYWHSDFETWHVEDGMPRMRALSICINLSDNHSVNGPLMLIPGSHRTFVSCVGDTPKNHFRLSLRRQEYGVPDSESLRFLVEQGGIDAVTGPAGTTVIFDCNTMHGSNGNITPYPRSNIFIVYNGVSNRVEAPFGTQAPRPEFLAERSCFEPVLAAEGPIARAD